MDIFKRMNWNDYIDICTEGAKALTDKMAGIVSRMKSKAPNCSFNRYLPHRQALAIKKMSPNLKLVLDEAVQIINFAKSRACTAMPIVFNSMW